MKISIVVGNGAIKYFQSSKYFRVDLGFVSTVEKNGRRVLNESDTFAYYYNSLYKKNILSKGRIGDILFYLDMYVAGEAFGAYIHLPDGEFEEFVMNIDRKLISEKGIDFYIGSIIKYVEEEKIRRDKEIEEREKIEKEMKDKKSINSIKKNAPVGDPQKVIKNPGAVTYADVRAYIEMKQRERYNR
jgi:hypothetical protein